MKNDFAKRLGEFIIDKIAEDEFGQIRYEEDMSDSLIDALAQKIESAINRTAPGFTNDDSRLFLALMKRFAKRDGVRVNVNVYPSKRDWHYDTNSIATFESDETQVFDEDDHSLGTILITPKKGKGPVLSFFALIDD